MTRRESDWYEYRRRSRDFRRRWYRVRGWLCRVAGWRLW